MRTTTLAGGFDGVIAVAGRTVRDLRIAEVVRQDLTIEDGKAAEFRVRLNVSFKYEGGAGDE